MPQSTDTAEVKKLTRAAAAAAPLWAAIAPAKRAAALDAAADELDGAADELIALGMRETNLPEGRLRGELKRTTFQLRLFGDVLREGSFLGVVIDHGDPEWPMGAARPDLRRVNIPLGPVVVFAASNFPFAFSVAGGDTASALAAGCPVIVKANPGHELLSERTAALVSSAFRKADVPEGVFAIAYGFTAGTDLVDDPLIQAGAFTGSLGAGRALFDRAARRPEPIPFYAEMGSTNPTFVTPEAASRRADQIVDGYVASVTGNDGQLCTKPGLLFAPRGCGIRVKLESALIAPPIEMLNDQIAAKYRESLEAMTGSPNVETLADAQANDISSRILAIPLDKVLEDPGHYFKEVFGPASLLIEYDDPDALVGAIAQLEGQLTATIFGESDEELSHELITALSDTAGRVLWNQWPTGLSVTWAQTHGGPYPATTAPATTSVGTAAIERFLRPVTLQNVPDEMLPAALQEANPMGIPRRVDGVLYSAH